jgi:hypothetical protein
MSRTTRLLLTLGIFLCGSLLISLAFGLVDTPNLLVMEQGDREHCVEMPLDAGNGRTVHVRGVALGPKWAPRDLAEQAVVVRNVAIPATTRKKEAVLFRDARVVVCVRVEDVR